MTDLEPREPGPESVDEPEVFRPGERPKPQEPDFRFHAPLLLRAIASVLLALGGLAALAVGAVLTLTIVGAWAGIPLLLLGLALLLLAVVTLFGGGKFTLRRF